MKTKGKLIAVPLLSLFVMILSPLMMAPQLMVLLPAASAVAGIILAIRRSPFSLVCFGYPLTFALLSALIGIAEVSGYSQTPGFHVSIAIGVAGAGLIATGLWKALTTKESGTTEQAR